MGEIADAMIEGELCEECGVLIDGARPGYPRKCSDCKPKQKKVKETFIEPWMKNIPKLKKKP